MDFMNQHWRKGAYALLVAAGAVAQAFGVPGAVVEALRIVATLVIGS